jgi:LacI family transcriptional regulator
MISGADRYEGYVAALTERNVPVEPALVVEGDYSESSGYYAMQQLLTQRPDALFAANDGMAIGALRAIRNAEYRVPEDIAVVGFDDIPLAAQASPPLTTIRQPIEQAGSLAAEMLMELIEQPDSSPKLVVLPTELVIRNSCGFRS